MQENAASQHEELPLEQDSFKSLNLSSDQTDENSSLSNGAIDVADAVVAKEQAAFLHAQKMESMGELATGMAHEINTPLQYIGGNLEFLQEGFEELTGHMARIMNTLEQAGVYKGSEPSQGKKIDFVMKRLPIAIRQCRDGVENVSRIVNAMRRFSHLSGEPKEANLNECIESTLTVSKGEWKYLADIRFEADEQLPKLLCFPGELNQAFLNLIVNAVHAIEEKLGENPEQKGEIAIRTFFDERSIGVEISDTGAGIPEDMKSRVFDQFVTTKDVGKGTGQGLAICWSIVVDKHGGKIDMKSQQGVGTTFTVTLPRDWQKPESADLF